MATKLYSYSRIPFSDKLKELSVNRHEQLVACDMFSIDFPKFQGLSLVGLSTLFWVLIVSELLSFCF